MVAAAMTAATTAVRLETRRSRRSRCRARAPPISGGGGPLFPTCVASRNSVWNGPRASRSSQIVHPPGGGECPRTPNSISLFIETLGARQGRRECRFRLLLGASDRGRRRLAIELCANRLRRHRPGVRISRGLAHRLLELRDPAAARTGMRRRDAEAKGGGNEQGCRRSADGSTAHFRASP